LGGCQHFGERDWASECEQAGWVCACRKPSVKGIQPIAAEYPEVTFGGDAAREIGVGGHDWLSTDAGQLMGLFVGERCAERCNPDATPLAGDGDGDGIHRAFHDHRDSVAGELMVEGAEQLRSLVEQRRVGGVEVFRSGQVDIGEVGSPSTNESENLAVMDDREDDPVPEPSIIRPVLAIVATPVISISSSVTPCRRRWSTRLVQPAGA
jgi:hypothetical protein